MNIVIVGAGAIGSLFGAFLSKKNIVILLARPAHVTMIQHHGLQITGKSKLHVNISAITSAKKINRPVDLLILTVKSYDTETAIHSVQPVIDKNTLVLSLQNGLDNIEKIQKYVNKKQILAGITTHGAYFSKPGHVIHTGQGKTLIGELQGQSSNRLKQIITVFNEAAIQTQKTLNIKKELWAKAIINSSINPLTAFLRVKNGHLLENPLLEKTVKKICEESTQIARAEGHHLTTAAMIRQTKKVMRDTAQNYSSMAQSIQQQKRTEIASINGKIIAIGKIHGIRTPLNEILTSLIKTENEHTTISK